MVCQGDKAANWEFFRQQWEDYEVATGLDQRDSKIRLATLRSVMGRECMQIFMNLKLTDEERKDVKTCVEALETHFKPKRNVVYERYVFNMCSQNAEETVDEFVNRIRKLASSCQFGTLTEELIRDKLVLGISDQSTKLRLLKEEDLTLNKAVNICCSSEIANIQLKSMKVSSKEVKEVHAVHGKTHRKSNKTPFNGGKTKLRATKDHQLSSKSHNSSKRKCYRCGRLLDHKLKDCPAFGQTCNSCGKENHFASVCLSSKQSTRDVRAIDESDKESVEESDEKPIFRIEDMSSVKAQGKQLYARLNFLSNSDRSGMQLECQLDTGATCNVMSYDDLSRIKQTGNPPLQSSKVKLRLFDGSLRKPIGATSLTVENHNNPARLTTEDLVFQVIETNNKPLLSAEACQKLGLIQLNTDTLHSVTDTLHSVAETNTPLSREEILSTYKDVFEGLGHIGNASFVIDDKCTPVQHAPQRIPVTIRK